MKKDNKRIFNLQEVGFTDLEGNFQPLNFDQKEFANVLFTQAQSIDMDDFARAIHKTGKAELNEQVEQELNQILPQAYKYRAVQAIKETISKIK